ncbi:DUF3592 domain-containing protein [Blastococcus sp. SYSU D01042]
MLSAVLLQHRREQGDAELLLRSDDGTAVRLRAAEAEGAATARALTGRDAPGLDPWRARDPGRVWWAAACLVVATLWVGLWTAIALDGYTATADVLRSDGGWTCTVTWRDLNGVRQQDDSDCFGEPVGSSIDILVPYGDFQGLVTTRSTTLLVGAVGAAPLLAVGAIRLLVVARRRRTNAALHRMAREAVPASDGHSVVPAAPETFRAMTRERRWAWLLVGLGAVGIVLVLAVAAIEITADEELRAVGITTVGTVMAVKPDEWWDAGAASVRFSADGVTRAREVILGGYADDYAAGDVVDVVYDPAAPERFIIDDALYGPDWTGWALLPALLLALMTPFGISRLVRVGRARRQFARTGTVPRRKDSGADWTTGLLDW